MFLIILSYFYIDILLQLPDYCEVIEHPMDFGTVRNKLANGAYATLEQFEVGSHACDYIFQKPDIFSLSLCQFVLYCFDIYLEYSLCFAFQMQYVLEQSIGCFPV